MPDRVEWYKQTHTIFSASGRTHKKKQSQASVTVYIDSVTSEIQWLKVIKYDCQSS